MTVCRHYYVSGRVQGVYYRASACDEARRLGLTGWVRNLDDGRVEALACGDASTLAEFERWLWKGPSAARVEQVAISEAAPILFDDFEIR
ncbi:MAG: acylphosphatase [Gammaproteobacteria bacterium]|nr:acylphosphatase [Gammaproteobacteria bacterium]